AGVIVTVDAFGNLISNIDERDIAQLAKPVAITSSHRVPFKRTYGDVKPGELLALINSFGVVELARGEGSASDALGAGRGAPLKVVEAD
ncbi:MAG: SAM hydroxide adenosyltransferase, partial [Pseudomonadota bacterium]